MISGISAADKVAGEITLMRMASFSKLQADRFLPEDVSIAFPMPGLLVNECPESTTISRSGHCRSLSAPAEASTVVSPWDVSPSAFQHLKENWHGWKWKNKRSKNTGEKRNRALSDRRVALEVDVAHLQTQLTAERAVRQGLERALNQNKKRMSGLLPSEVPSSTFSPKAKELISEIASLETEVASLEQHVLSLYRKLLDTQISQSSALPSGRDGLTDTPFPPPTPQEPDPESSPAQPQQQPGLFFRLSLKRKSPNASQHRRNGSGPGTLSNGPEERGSTTIQTTKSRHVSLLGGAFNCIDGSSAEETSQHQIPVVFTHELTTSHSCSEGDRMEFPFGGSCGENIKRELFAKSPRSAYDPLPTSGFRSAPGFGGTGKLYTESPRFYAGSPNRLSEELVRCMAAIFCNLADPPLSLNTSPFSPSSPSSSASSTTTTSSPRGFSTESWSPRWGRADSCIELSLPDPFQLKDHKGDVVGAYNSAVEVPWICVDKDRLNYAARALRNFRSMVEQLENVDPCLMTHDEKTAFWINIYNALMMHAYLAYGIPRSHLKRIALVQKASYKIGSHSINAHTIENCILGCRSRRPTQWLQTLFTTGPKFKAGDERKAFALEKPEPLVCFALCSGGRSDPAIRVYSAKHVQQELQIARREYLHASIGVRSESRVLLPRLLEWYAKEVSVNPANVLDWVSHFVTDAQQVAIRKCLHSRSHKSAAQSVEWLSYNCSFRYIFVTDLARICPLSSR